MNYFNGINLRFSSNTLTTNWLQLEKGLVTRCTISVILFVKGMHMIIKAAERVKRAQNKHKNPSTIQQGIYG
ncbi:hypothetical protein DPMN_012298 [Dreissena polymorpha]|uniref:Uncharacterized protein n=1 Tax=Dreissena polymorpha TaxID=45954 RepID=A0A9D4N5K5_DREPO|nr:hypothetical protein DPMN_012298 [Dreissena polymorpha]